MKIFYAGGEKKMGPHYHHEYDMIGAKDGDMRQTEFKEADVVTLFIDGMEVVYFGKIKYKIKSERI